MTGNRLRSLIALIVPLFLAQLCSAQSTATTQSATAFTPPVYTQYPLQTESVAFYYPWYCGSNWDNRLTQMNPQIGRYDSRLTSTMNTHMQWARQAHLTGLVVSWWGTNNTRGQRIEALMPNLLAAAAGQNIRLMFLIENYTGRTPASVANDIAGCIARYRSYSAWYTSTRRSPFLQNTLPKPVFFIYDVDSNKTVTPSQWTAALDSIHASQNAIVLARASSQDVAWVNQGHFDGIYDYSYTYPFKVRNVGTRLPSNAWYVPSVCPGFDAYRSKGWTTVIKRNNGAYYDTTWNNALGSGLAMPMVAVTSFNEWFESTAIEPAGAGTDTDGFAFENYTPLASTSYLDQTGRWADNALLYQYRDYAVASQVYSLFGGVNSEFGLYQNDWGSDGNTQAVVVGGRAARRNKTGNNKMYLQIHRRFLTVPTQRVTVRVDYFDAGGGSLWLEYNGPSSAYQKTPRVAVGNTNTWRTATFTIGDATFNGLQNGSSDLRVAVTSGYTPAVGLISLVRN